MQLKGLFPLGKLDELVYPCGVLNEAHGEFLVGEQAGSKLDGRQTTREISPLQTLQDNLYPVFLEEWGEDFLVLPHSG